MPWQARSVRRAFVRPPEADLSGEVNFFERGCRDADGTWHLIAGPEKCDAPLRFRQSVTVADALLEDGRQTQLARIDGLTPWLYVMDGVIVLGDTRLKKGDAVTDLTGNLPLIRTEARTTLVALYADRSQSGSIAGSGA